MRGNKFIVEVDKDIGGVTIQDEECRSGDYCNLQTPEEWMKFVKELLLAGMKAFEKKGGEKDEKSNSS